LGPQKGSKGLLVGAARAALFVRRVNKPPFYGFLRRVRSLATFRSVSPEVIGVAAHAVLSWGQSFAIDKHRQWWLPGVPGVY